MPTINSSLKERQDAALPHARCAGLASALQLALFAAHRFLKDGALADVSDTQIESLETLIRRGLEEMVGSGMGQQSELTRIALEMEPHGVAFADLLYRLADTAEFLEGQEHPVPVGAAQ